MVVAAARLSVAVAVVASLLSVGGEAGAAPGDSAVVGLGRARSLGAPAGPVVGIAATPTGDGYWLVAPDGGVFTYGDAAFHGSAGALSLVAPIVAMATTPTGRGYWLVASDGGVFAYGDAAFHGSAGAIPLVAPIVGMATTPTGRGYWLVAADGGVFTYGDAPFLGSAGAIRLQQPIVAMTATPTGRGYRLVASDGGVFTYGDAAYHGGLGGFRLQQPIVGAASTPTGDGYWLAAADGGVFTFGDAPFHGSGAGALTADHAVVAMTARRDGSGYWLASAVRSVTIAATGDVHGEGPVRALLERGGNPFAAMAPTLRSVDVSMINLETPVGSLGEPSQKEFVFQAPPALLRAARDAGVDVVNLANNHSLDHGPEALAETIANARAAGLAVVGAGRNAVEAYAPALVGPPGRRVAVVGLTRVLPGGWAAGPDRPGVASAFDVGAATRSVRAAAAAAEHVVVMVHWGVEYERCPARDRRDLTDQLVAAGADVVAGHHPHVVQGVERRGRAVVANSLGNFVWYHHNPPSDVGGVLVARLDHGGVRSHSFEPTRIDGTGTPNPMGGAEADVVRREVAAGYC